MTQSVLCSSTSVKSFGLAGSAESLVQLPNQPTAAPSDADLMRTHSDLFVKNHAVPINPSPQRSLSIVQLLRHLVQELERGVRCRRVGPAASSRVAPPRASTFPDAPMNRLKSELQRLYLAPSCEPQDSDPDGASRFNSDGQVRAMVLELARPAAWEPLSKVWRGVQTDLGLPAPAIAVNGLDGYQLWFSLAEPLPAAQAAAFLELLRLRYLGDVAKDRLRLLPAVDVLPPLQALQARWVPALQAESGNWSAFLAPDLAPVFADEPWLDIEPNPVGQSDLLSRHDSIRPADFQIALGRLGPAAMLMKTETEPSTELMAPAVNTEARAACVDLPEIPPKPTTACLDPKLFLLDVMNNEAVVMSLRIDAAKALLPYFGDRWSK